jgi:hypothetical protein
VTFSLRKGYHEKAAAKNLGEINFLNNSLPSQLLYINTIFRSHLLEYILPLLSVLGEGPAGAAPAAPPAPAGPAPPAAPAPAPIWILLNQ